MKKRRHDPSDEIPASTPELLEAPVLAFPVIGIGASAGGLEAFFELIGAMPPKSGMALVFILHLPPGHKSLLPELLASRTDMEIKQVADGLRVEPNTVYVIRPGFTITLRDGAFELGEPLEKQGHRHPVDDFFRSLAREQKERAIAVILSGMGSNGTLGAQDIRAAGGLCIAQEPGSAKYPSMPESLIQAGRADLILRPSAIPEKLVGYGTHPYVRGTYEEQAGTHDGALQEILQLLRDHGCPDFAGYKQPTLVRRIERRMGLRQLNTMQDYVGTLRGDSKEILALADDLVINVTGFFRDPDVWRTLREKIIVPLVEARPNGSSLRAWVSACSSGEEAYTVAILLLEAAQAAKKHFNIKIFATDVANRQLASARRGTFPAAIEDDVTPTRLKRYFERVDSTYRARKELREIVVFASHSLLSDPPFSHLDLCTCRNLLIYLEPPVQERVLSLMHFALARDGALLLGSSETVGGAHTLFEPVDKKARIYRRIGPTRHDLVNFSAPRPHASAVEGANPGSGNIPASIAHLAQQALLQNYGPAAVVVDRSQRIVYYFGATARFVEQPRGEPTRDLMALVRVELRSAVRKALVESLASGGPSRTAPILLEFQGRRSRVTGRVAPLEARNPAELFLVSFEELPEEIAVRAPGRSAKAGAAGIPDLEQELHRVREDLQSKIGELQSNNEELKASNEETVSINEELQSTNEELETSKEELQSLNEELTSVNAQLQAKMVELETTTNDLASLLSSTSIAVIFLDPQLSIRRFTPAMRDLIELIPQDVGRPLRNLAWKFTDGMLLADARSVLDGQAPISREIDSQAGHNYLRAILPYQTNQGRAEGVVITFIDVTERDRAERALRNSEEQHRLMLESLRDYAIFLLDAKGVIQTWPKGAERLLGYTADDAVGHPLSLIFPPEDQAAAEEEFRGAQIQGMVSQEGWRQRKDGTRFWGSGVLSVAVDERGRPRGFVKVLHDDTQRRLAEENLHQARRKAEEANEAKDQFLATVSHELRTPLSSILLWTNLINEDGTMEAELLEQALGAIKQGVEEQRELIEDLVDTARIAAGKLSLTKAPTDLVAVARSAVDSIETTAVHKGLKINRQLQPVGIVEVDSVRIRQVIANLLSNSVKFTGAGGDITVKLSRQGEGVEIVVTDTGQGFTAEFQPSLFTRFEQASKTSTRAHGGLGIGLSIVKQLVLLHGGTITGESPGPGLGAKFVVRLPLPVLGGAPKAPSGSPFSSRSQLTGVLQDARVLLVEDSPETQRALAAVLREAGAQVTLANNAALALIDFEEAPPELILSDIGLPGMDGYQLIQRIREVEQRRQLKPTPALALSAFAGPDTARRALTSGFQRYLDKPIEPLRLITALAELRSQP